MAVLFMDSFSHYLTSQILRKWGSLAANPVIQNTTSLHPGAVGCINFPSSGTENNVISRTFTSAATFIVGFFVQFSNPLIVSTFLQTYDTGTLHLDLRLDATGHLVVTRNGTALVTSVNAFSANTWYHIEFKATIHDSAGVVEVRVNGSSVNWIPSTGSLDTRNAANASINQIKLRNGGNGNAVTVTGLWVLDTTGSVANDFLGPKRVVCLRPVGVGNYSQWTPNYAGNFVNVQDEVADDDSTFNQSATANQIDTFPMTEVPAGASVYGVQHCILARQDAGAQRTIAPVDRISSTDYVGTTYNTGATYLYHLVPETVSPATSAAWTAAELNGAEAGYKITA